MAVIRRKPVNNSQRFYEVPSFKEIQGTGSIKGAANRLIKKKDKSAGRNNTGKITVRHHGGGNRQKYRVIDFKRNHDGVPAKVAAIEYDPGRSAYICLLYYADGFKAYILSPVGLNVGDTVMSGEKAEIKVGNNLALSMMPVGTIVHNIEFRPGEGGKMARSAGVSARLMAKEGNYALLRLPSGEMRKVPVAGRATIGQVGNVENEIVSLGKAGRVRHMGIRPTVRGSVMNPVDHPHGGGEGKSPIGYAGPRTPWGKAALGLKTRDRKKSSTKLIISRKKK